MAIIGMDIHRSFAQAAFLQDGQVKREQRVDLVHNRLVRFGKSLSVEDEVVIEVTGNSAAVERILRPFVKRVVVANPRMSSRLLVRRRSPAPSCAAIRCPPQIQVDT
jgi:transposase